MLKNAFLYESEIRDALYDTWYEEDMQWYWPRGRTGYYSLNPVQGDTVAREFASLGNQNDLIGVIRYNLVPDTKSAVDLSAINFKRNESSTVFARDLIQVVDDIFSKFGLFRLEFEVVIGNPVEKSYDRMVRDRGGRIVGIKHNSATNMRGDLCDEKIYEIQSDQYFRSKYAMSRQ